LRGVPGLQFRLPGRADKLGAWLASLFPDVDRATRRSWVGESRVSVEGRVVDRLSRDCRAGARVEIADVPEEVLPTLPAGPHSSWIGLIDEPAWPGGALYLNEKQTIEFSVRERSDGLALIRLDGPRCEAEAIRRALARAEMPLVGDLEGGGLAAAGGVRLSAIDERGSESLEWPDEPAWISLEAPTDRSAGRETGISVLQVSDETARVIRRGHPWILPDAASDSATRFRPGTLVRVASRAGGDLGWARIEADRRLAARVWAMGAPSAGQIPSVEARVARALALRRELFSDQGDRGTNAFRLIHSEGDALPGIVVDRLGPLLRVLVTGRASELIRDRVLAALRSQLPLTPEGEPWSILELNHVRGTGRSHFDRVRWLSGGLDALAACGLGMSDIGFRVLERGLRFNVDPGWETPRKVRPGYGLFVDQRENRARLEPHAARGGDWLNLFAHTGAFSVSLLAAGAERVMSVDLSAAYLQRLEANLVANRDRGVDLTRNESICIDGRRFLETLRPDQRFAGIVLDPPTAAAAGRRFWSLRQDLEPLLRRCVERLDSGGVLLVTQNRNGPPLGLDRILERIVSRSHRSIECLEPAPAGVDHPGLSGFPEGEPFEGWLLRLD
jgi:23S rRNA (cytosine1962-C5)-methyltransferase